MYIKTNALVLREAVYKESSRMLTVLTAEHGKLSVAARGAKRKGSRLAAACQPLTYAELTLFTDRGRYTLTEAHPLSFFEGLTEDLRLLSLGAYFAEVLEAVSDEDSPSPELLSLGLNALYALSKNLNRPGLIKAAFELRVACLAGFTPQVSACAQCGRAEPENPVFDLTGGILTCRACASPAGQSLRPSRGTVEALRYLVSADPKRLYRFTVGEETERQLTKLTEAYLLTQLGTDFPTLGYYKKL